MKTRILAAVAFCLFVGSCSSEPDAALAEQEAVFKMVEEFGKVNAAGDYEKAWEYLSKAKQESFNQLLTQPVTGARDVVANMRPIVAPESAADPAEKERVKGILEKYPPWERLKNMSAKEYYAFRMEKDYPAARKAQATAFYHRDNIKEMVLEGGSGYIDWLPADAKRQFVVKEDGAWKLALDPKQEREYAASKTKAEKR